MKKALLAALLPAAALIATPAAADHHAMGGHEAALAAAVASDIRAEDAARDAYRHPAEVLEFFQVEPGMTVVDYYPGGDPWWAKILVPYLGPDGTYVGTLKPLPMGDEAAQARVRQFPETFPASVAEAVPGGGAKVVAFLDENPESMVGNVDRVLIFRFMHNMMRFNMVRDELTRIRALLKDDGMLGIVQHRAKPWASGDYTDGSKGYLRQSDVIGLVEAHGFELVGTSEVNANPKDSADHANGVWEMPPRLATKRDDLKDLGESDRMTLLFRKR